METKRQCAVGSFRQWPFGLAPVWVACFALLSPGDGHAQLAITEVMSSAATNRGSTAVRRKSDFWELTNFGTNSISLDDYSYSDNSTSPSARVFDPFYGCVIGPGETMILVRTDPQVPMTTPQEFLNWWGPQNMPGNLQVRMCPNSPGFDATVDAVQLFNPAGELVDRVDFGRARVGHTFVYDSATGDFGQYSAFGVNGAVRAVQADDVGSPGITTGPVPLSILEQPVSVTQDAGLDAEFSVRAAGLPRPTYRWFFNGVLIAGAKGRTLVVSNVHSGHAGNYEVRIGNGLMSLTGAPATLVVTTNPLAPIVLQPPRDETIFINQSVAFSVNARGYPPPRYQWQTNGVNVPGATNNNIVISSATPAMSGRLYSVLISNIHGSTNVSARLTVTPRPSLAITEAMSAVNGGSTSGHTDWFELTNLGTNDVDLFGYRIADTYSRFDVAFRITNSLIIRPRESVIFTERLTPQEFVQWWGAERIPPNVQIRTYYGFGLSEEDVLCLWNSAETDENFPLVEVGLQSFDEGVSLRSQPPQYQYVDNSVVGQDGSFRALVAGDIGSPGYITNPPPRFLGVTAEPSEVHLRCRVTEGKTYGVLWKAKLSDLYWDTAGTHAANDCVMTVSLSPTGAGRFFRLMELP